MAENKVLLVTGAGRGMGVDIARAASCAEIRLSSKSSVAYLPLKSTLTEFTPLVFFSDPSRVVAQAPQCNPVTMYVALVISALSACFFDSCA